MKTNIYVFELTPFWRFFGRRGVEIAFKALHTLTTLNMKRNCFFVPQNSICYRNMLLNVKLNEQLPLNRLLTLLRNCIFSIINPPTKLQKQQPSQINRRFLITVCSYADNGFIDINNRLHKTPEHYIVEIISMAVDK